MVRSNNVFLHFKYLYGFGRGSLENQGDTYTHTQAHSLYDLTPSPDRGFSGE